MADESKPKETKEKVKKTDKNTEAAPKSKDAAVAAPATGADGAPVEAAADEVKKKSKITRIVPTGIAYVHSTFNNTKVTFTDLHGNVLCWGSAGRSGFKGSKKSTAYVAQLVATETAKKAQALGMKEAEVRIKGPGAGRESAVRGIVAAGIEILALQDITPVPHNGCRPAKRRRV
ncbi:MAG TPA: 30S ribosomal protein S11 [Lentisphaeria bacterium]|nr:30S ribosomal protein S11 [Lentisphaeria bacterium]